ncbi:AlbA family DNA-binding domain-containing protein [Burkholderia gladioli]|uniref:AlbA family DNA-binding domain-containing protein n=1 Tax=Burkholderia gladioli TaxID=28095 RepID=UPI00163FAF69|nr:ATP-binding protein [Burkholderia gladioli]MBU9426443.1 ATP-binding protein [Burkholderia gladioli]MDN8063404.1 ATP-binding protein [Burkholderia gladioli]
MINSPISSLSEGDLQRLCEDRAVESQTLDFKRTIPGKDDRSKNEFLKDVCAFANGNGGDLLYGIDECDGVASSIVPVTTESLDDLQRRLSQILDAGIEPRLVGVQTRGIAVDGGYVLSVRVPASFNGPHRYILNGHSKFVMRTGTHTSELSYDQLRGAFDKNASLAGQAKLFVAERIEAIRKGHSIRPLIAGPQSVLHVIPVGMGIDASSVDVASLHDGKFTEYVLPGWPGATRSLNLEGLVVHPPADADGHYAYLQVFRSGAIEAVTFAGHSFPDRKIIPSTTASKFFRDALQIAFRSFRTQGISGPAVIGGAILGVDEYELGVDSRSFSFNRFASDRDNMFLPRLWVDDVGSAEVDAYARPLLDVMWQAFGATRCIEYSEDGRWQPRA